MCNETSVLGVLVNSRNEGQGANLPVLYITFTHFFYSVLYNDVVMLFSYVSTAVK